MIRIAIVDDDIKLCSKIEQILLAYDKVASIDIDIEVLYNGEDFYKFIINEHDFDLVFLDIQMDRLDGIEIGHLIREKLKNNLMQIVYITSLDNRDRELFAIRPMGFIAKPIKNSDIVKSVDTYLELFKNMNKMFDFISDRQHFKIPYEQIIYLTSDDKLISLYTDNNTFSFYGQLSDVAKGLPFQFFSIHKSYIINKFYIIKYNYDNVIMINNERIPISQKNQKNVRKLLMQDSFNAGEEFFANVK